MIVATAGHIDHGKTALVKALTGVDTDRLPEEKARKISIDLGFAYWNLANGDTIAFVDVPGHERFVRNMLAGVCGIDFVVLVIAADDGVMPQTIEHLNIIDLLSVSRGVAVISKIDRVSPARVAEVEADVRRQLASSKLASIDIQPVSALTGAGIDRLRNTLIEAASRTDKRLIEGRNFRYAIDRAFNVKGTGTVVTGTVFDGVTAVGARLKLSPSGIDVRIREIQKDGTVVTEAKAGERCALNLAGAGVNEVHRGDWIATAAMASQRIDVRLQLLPDERQPLKHWSPVHLHIGTSDIGARISTRSSLAIAPGTSAFVQLVTERPVAAVAGDRFIIRDQSARRTLGGGVVIDPFAPAKRADSALRMAQLQALTSPDAERALAALVAYSPSGVNLESFGRAFNLTPDYRDSLARTLDLVSVEGTPPVALERRVVDRIRHDLTRLVSQDADGAQSLSIAALRTRIAPSLASGNFTALLRKFAPDIGLEVSSSSVRRTAHIATANRVDETLWQRVKPLLDDAGVRGMLLNRLALAAAIDQGVLTQFLNRMERVGNVIRAGEERYYPRATIVRLAAAASEVASRARDQQFTAAQFRDEIGVSRIIAVDILECLDRLGITRRVQQFRKMRKDYVLVLGTAVTDAVKANPIKSPAGSSGRATSDEPRLSAMRESDG